MGGRCCCEGGEWESKFCITLSALDVVGGELPAKDDEEFCEGCFLFAIVAWAPGIVFKKLGKGTTSGSGEFAKLAPAYLGSCPFMLLLLFLFFPLFGEGEFFMGEFQLQVHPAQPHIDKTVS